MSGNMTTTCSDVMVVDIIFKLKGIPMFKVMYILGDDPHETEDSVRPTKTEAIQEFRNLGHRLIMMHDATLWIEDERGWIIILREINGK